MTDPYDQGLADAARLAVWRLRGQIEAETERKSRLEKSLEAVGWVPVLGDSVRRQIARCEGAISALQVAILAFGAQA